MKKSVLAHFVLLDDDNTSVYVQYWHEKPPCIRKNGQSNQAINLMNTGSYFQAATKRVGS